jgi:hypothetical protein
MKYRPLKIIWLSLLLLGLPVIGSSQEEPIENHPGYLNLDAILDGANSYVTSEVYLRNYILRMVARVTRKQEPDFANMLDAIKLIRVVEFRFDGEGATSTLAKAEQLVSHLSSKRWDTLVRNRDGDKVINICIQSDQGEHIYALAIVTWDSEKMTVVNVVGDINLEMLSRLGSQFGIGELEDVNEASGDAP